MHENKGTNPIDSKYQHLPEVPYGNDQSFQLFFRGLVDQR